MRQKKTNFVIKNYVFVSKKYFNIAKKRKSQLMFINLSYTITIIKFLSHIHSDVAIHQREKSTVTDIYDIKRWFSYYFQKKNCFQFKLNSFYLEWGKTFIRKACAWHLKIKFENYFFFWGWRKLSMINGKCSCCL